MFKRLLIVAAALLFASALSAQPLRFQEGVHYFKIEPAQPSNPPPGKVEVTEVFSYACIHCAHFEPLVNKWKQSPPAQASFDYLPAVFNPTWEAYARAYYAAKVMGVIEKSHAALFDAVFVEKLPLRTVTELAGFFERFGKSSDEALKAMNSFSVTTSVERAKRQAMAYQVDGTPTVVVAGKWRVTGASAGSMEAVFDVVNYLVSLEAARLPKPLATAEIK